MTRPKLKFAWVEDRKARKAACQQSLKKAEKLTKLCNTSDCLVFFSRDDDKLVVWPTREEAKSLVELFYALPENQRNMKAEDQEPYIKEDNTKMIEKVIEELEMDHLIIQLQNGKMLIALSQTEIENLISYVSKKITSSSVNEPVLGDEIPKASDVYKMDKWFLDEDENMETYGGESSKSGDAGDD